MIFAKKIVALNVFLSNKNIRKPGHSFRVGCVYAIGVRFNQCCNYYKSVRGAKTKKRRAGSCAHVFTLFSRCVCYREAEEMPGINQSG